MLRLLFMFAACLCGMAALAQDLSNRDMREVLAYTLSEAGLANYIEATRNLAVLPDGMPGACEDETGESSIDEMVASLNAWPGASNAIRSAGMSTREYVVFGWSVFQNAMAAWTASTTNGSLPEGASQANADFVVEHQADLERLGEYVSDEDCEDAYDEVEDAVEE